VKSFSDLATLVTDEADDIKTDFFLSFFFFFFFQIKIEILDHYKELSPIDMVKKVFAIAGDLVIPKVE
jgi:hypothetical protein